MTDSCPKEMTVQHSLAFPVWPQVPDEVMEAVRMALHRSQLDRSVLNGLSGIGPIERFESDFAELVGAKYSLAVNSGDSALHLALLAAGVGPGDEVILSSYGWGQVLVFLDALDAVPVFGDIDPDTLCLDAASVAERLTGRTKAVIVTHQAEHPADVSAVNAAAEQVGAVLIEDYAQALGASIRGYPVGILGEVALFSFGPRKHLPLAEGEALVTDERVLFERAMSAGQHPDRAALQIADPRLLRSADEFFWPYRMHPLAAVMGQAMLPLVSTWKCQRQRNHEHFLGQLGQVPQVQVHPPAADCEHAWATTPFSYQPLSAQHLTRAQYAKLLADAGVPVQLGPVRTPLHLRLTAVSRWGPQPACPVAEYRCAHQELAITDTIGWVGDQSELVDALAAVLLHVSQKAAQQLRRGNMQAATHCPTPTWL